MRSRRITRFGSPLAPSGALYFVSDQDGLVQMDVDLELAKLEAKGMFVTRDIKSLVKDKVKQRRAEYRENVDRVGIPKNLKGLFSITSKSKAEQYSRNIVISEYDLFLLIHNCSQIRFSHRSRFRQYVPDHLLVSDTDRNEMKEGSPKKFTKKVSATLLERRYVHVHLFECGSDWHCFYFSHQDIEPTESNHWKYGCHVHYVSHLWPNLKKKWVWSRFSKRYTDISDSLHIRFEPFVFPSPDEPIKNYPKNGSNVPPWTLIFDPNLARGSGSDPLPVAQLAIRGAWITKVSLPHKSLR